jgi:hypothetical protein
MITALPAPPTAPKVRQVTGGWCVVRATFDPDEHETLTDIRSRCPHLTALSRL